MRDIMSNSGGFASTRVSTIGDQDPGSNNNYIWTTEKINKLMSDINDGIEDIRKLKNSPFKDNDISLKREKLPFEYTPEEVEELKKCKANPIYFAFNYCVIQTNNGRMLVKDAGGLRDFQSQIIKSYKNNNLNILMASRQTGKCLSLISNVLVYDTLTNRLIETPIFKLYFEAIKNHRKLTIFEKLKYFLYKISYYCQEAIDK
jgi:hypothetical protein